MPWLHHGCGWLDVSGSGAGEILPLETGQGALDSLVQLNSRSHH